MSLRSKATFFSLLNVLAASIIYWYLISGGWLTNEYHLNDPNIINLLFAIFEPIAVLSVVAYWVWRNPILYRLIFVLALIQVLIGTGFLIFILVFMLSWHPKMI